jgi:hypothetical protein
VHLVNLVSPLIEGGSEGEAVGVAIRNVVGVGGVGSHSAMDETLCASRQPGFPLNGGWE